MFMNRGFTLIELLVAMTIFTLVLGSGAGLFVSAVQSQRRSLANQELLDQTSYAIEYMSRSLRMAKKERNAPACLSSNGLNYEIVAIEAGILGLKFINHLQDDDCQAFFIKDGQLKYRKEIGAIPKTLNLTSENLTVDYLNFELSGKEQTDNLQPRVTFSLGIEYPEEGVSMKIQTTISQRNLDVEY